MNDCRDRTGEFMQLVDSMSTNGGNSMTMMSSSSTAYEPPHHRNRRLLDPPNTQAPLRPPGTTSAQVRFARAAGSIMHGIQGVSVKLEKLTSHCMFPKWHVINAEAHQVAKQKSLFKDPTKEIQELRFVVKEEITRLSDDIQHLQNFMETSRAKGHSRNHSTAVVKDLQVKLAETTKDFQGILEMRTKSLQAQASRRKRYGDARGLSLRKREVNSFGRVGTEGKTHSQMLVQEQQQSRANEEYLSSRAETVQDIEKMLGELGGIYERMLNMVQAQGEVAISIERNLEETNENVSNGVAELKTLLSSVSSNRWLIIKVFFVLILFAVFFTVFVA
eukprot:jgi/Bigna1/86545/estExt_fgenesh1_pg.C_110167